MARAGLVLPQCLNVQINEMSMHGCGSADIFIAVLDTSVQVRCMYNVCYYKG